MQKRELLKEELSNHHQQNENGTDSGWVMGQTGHGVAQAIQLQGLESPWPLSEWGWGPTRRSAPRRLWLCQSPV